MSADKVARVRARQAGRRTTGYSDKGHEGRKEGRPTWTNLPQGAPPPPAPAGRGRPLIFVIRSRRQTVVDIRRAAATAADLGGLARDYSKAPRSWITLSMFYMRHFFQNVTYKCPISFWNFY